MNGGRMRKKFLVMTGVALVLAFGLTACAEQETKSMKEGLEESSMVKKKTKKKAKSKAASKSTNSHIVIETNMGSMTIEMYEKRAPITTANFLKLVDDGYFDGIIFHRIIAGFMIQGGDPTGTGKGGPGYSIEDEFHSELRHTGIGILSMANSGPNTGGSQFFITLAPTPHLDNRHAVFGKVVEGLDVLKAIGSVETGSRDRPAEDVVMEKVSRKKKGAKKKT